MINERSEKGEIRDLQRLLIELGFLQWREDSEPGWWGDETQDAVLAAYRYIGWDHAWDGRWVSCAALAAFVGACHKHGSGDPADDYSEKGIWDPEDEQPAKTGGAKTGTGGAKTGTGGAKTGTGGAKTGTGGAKTGTGGAKTGTGGAKTGTGGAKTGKGLAKT